MVSITSSYGTESDEAATSKMCAFDKVRSISAFEI